MTPDTAATEPAQSQVAVTYDDLHGNTWRYTFCEQHRPRVIADENMLNARTERTEEPCSLGCSPRLNWRVCTPATGHLPDTDHRWQECPTYHEDGE